MALITLAGSIAAAETSFDMRFRSAFQGVTPLYQQVATRVTSRTQVQNFPVTASMPKLRKWEGERQVNNAKAYSYTLTNEKYESTLGIPLEDWEDDLIEVYQPTVDDMGQQAALWPDDLVFAALKAGETENSYDGVPFFSNSHSLGGRTLDNLFASTALTHANYGTVREAMGEYVNESGDSLRVVPNLLVVPPALEQQALEIVKAQYVPEVFGSNTAAATKTNVWANSAQVLVVPQLASAAGGSDTSWYLLATGRPVKPLIFQERIPPQFARKTQLDDDSVFWDDKVYFGIRARGTAGFGPFWLAAKATA